MKVGFVTQWYPPETGTVVPRALAQGLVERGHAVHVLTGFPNYPSGTLYPGYPLRPYRRDHDGEVVVHRAPLFPNHGSSAALRMVNYLSFSLSASVVSVTAFPTVDVWLTYSSPATAALPGMIGAKVRRQPHAMIVQDLWPDSVTGSGMASGTALRAITPPLSFFSKASYRSADAIGVISPGMRRVLESRGIPGERIHDTPNWVPDPGQFPTPDRAQEKKRLGLPTTGVLFLYAGNFGEMQDLEGLLATFAHVQGGQLVVMGSGSRRSTIEKLAADREDVHVLPPVGADEVPNYQRAADILVVSLQDTPLLRVTMPSKVQSSMAAGRPLFVHGAGDVANVVESNGAGAAGAPGSPRAVLAAQQLIDMSDDDRARLGSAARECYQARFAPDAGAGRIHELLTSAVERRNST